MEALLGLRANPLAQQHMNPITQAEEARISGGLIGRVAVTTILAPATRGNDANGQIVECSLGADNDHRVDHRRHCAGRLSDRGLAGLINDR
jgi:hypothetical protein